MTGDDEDYQSDLCRVKAGLAEIDFDQLTPKQIEAHDRKARKASISFPALLLDDGRIICWRTSDQRPPTLVLRPTDNPKRAAEMKALIEWHSSPLQ
jgi:hypothetical protein